MLNLKEVTIFITKRLDKELEIKLLESTLLNLPNLNAINFIL